MPCKIHDILLIHQSPLLADTARQVTPLQGTVTWYKMPTNWTKQDHIEAGNAHRDSYKGKYVTCGTVIMVMGQNGFLDFSIHVYAR
jgi:hypothetical protein